MTGLLSPVHIALVVLVLLLVFGGRRAPELGRLTGRTIRTRVLGQPPGDPPTALPEPLPAARSSRAVVPRQTSTVTPAAGRSVRRRVVFVVLRRVPGPVGFIARLFAR
jgi:hypothetical protein